MWLGPTNARSLSVTAVRRRRQVVTTEFLVAGRIASAGAVMRGGAVFPIMPPECWLHVASFLSFFRWSDKLSELIHTPP